MKTRDVLNFFNDSKGKGGYERCWRMLGLSSATPSLWGEVVPRGMAFELEHLTGGLLKVDMSCYEPMKRDTEEKKKALNEWINAKRLS